MTEVYDPDKELRQALARMGSTQDHMVGLKWLYDKTGYFKPSAALKKNGDIDVEGTFYNEARRDIWIEIRKSLPPDVLYQIEIMPIVRANEARQKLLEELAEKNKVESTIEVE